MRVKSIWQEKYKSIVDNGRDHKITMDLPYLQDGTDSGATALEVAVMGYAGCITTIYAMMAEKLKVSFTEMTCHLEAEKGVKTIEKIIIKLDITSDSDENKLRKAFEMTCKNCPVGVIFEQAGIKVDTEINITKA